MTSRVEGEVTYTQNFDIENRLASVTVNSQTTTFVYDGDGNLVKKLKPDGTSTVYIGGIYEVDLDASSQITKKTSYYPAGGAMRVEVVGVSNTLYYMLRDHLGSASVTLDASGNVVTNGEQRYYPFGESRITSAALPTDRLFTGQRFVDGTGGLYHYGARFYLPYLNRWIQPDTIVPEPDNPPTLNRFAYVNNNPVKYVDPTGHEACYDTGLEIGRDISQADCWAYGADKWINGLPVAGPVAGQGYNTVDGLLNNFFVAGGSFIGDDFVHLSGAVTWLKGFTENQLKKYAQNQGGHDTGCAAFSIAMVLNLLFGGNISGADMEFWMQAGGYKAPGLGAFGDKQAEVLNNLFALIDQDTPPFIATLTTGSTKQNLLDNLANGYPTIVNVSWGNSWGGTGFGDNVGHAMVLVGYDNTNSQYVFLNPLDTAGTLDYWDEARFNIVWQNQPNWFIGSGTMISVKPNP